MDQLNILLVEDDKVNQLVAEKILRQWGMNVTIANSGPEALDQIRSRSFNLVLMDINMPGMDGYETTERIRAMDDLYFISVPILAFTASALVNSKEDAINHGMDEVIQKPLRTEDAYGKIMSHALRVQSRVTEGYSLKVNLEIFTHGDVLFKAEIIALLVENLSELGRALRNMGDNQIGPFLAAFHKSATPVSIVGDEEFTVALNRLRDRVKNADKLTDSVLRDAVSLDKRCEIIVKALEAELT